MLKDSLKAVYDVLNAVPSIKWVDEDFGQIDFPAEKPPVVFPCALVSLNQQATHLGGDEYDLANSISVRVAHSRLGDRPAKSSEAAFALTLAKADDVDAVKDAMIEAGYYYRGLITERRADGLSCRVLTFERIN